MSSRGLSPEDLDFLRELSSIGAGHAATSLCKLLGRRKVSLQVPRVEAPAFAEAAELLGGAELPVAGISLAVDGAFSGDVLLVFPIGDAEALAALVTGRERAPLDDLGRSALKEVGNIIASSYLNALAQLLGGRLMPSVPAMAEDMAGAVMDDFLIRQGEHGDQALVLVNEFSVEGERFVGYFLLLPGPGTLQACLEALHVRA